MQDIQRFQELLSNLLKTAKKQDNHIDIKLVQNLLKEVELNETQLNQVYSYLAMNHIKIEGYVDSTKTFEAQESNQQSLTKDDDYQDNRDEVETRSQKVDKQSKLNLEDSQYIKMYLEDLKDITAGTLKEEEGLLLSLKKGNDSVKSRITEIYLSTVVDIAMEYKNNGLLLEDLIQEGNIGLVSSLDELITLNNGEEMRTFLTKQIRQWIELAINEHKDSKDFEQNVINKINYIYNAITELEKDLGREVTIEELSAHTKYPKEDLEEILKLCIEDLTNNNSNQHNHIHDETCNHEHDHK